MNEPAFERRCRRLLRWYPPDHRREHEDEMLSVMLAAGRPGQRRLGLRETADVVLGGIRVRAQRSFGRRAASRWRDALAVTAVLGTVLLLIDSVIRGVVAAFIVRSGSVDPPSAVVVYSIHIGAAAVLATGSLWAIATRRRSMTAAATWALALTIIGGGGYYWLSGGWIGYLITDYRL
jgi:hypothetical protein